MSIRMLVKPLSFAGEVVAPFWSGIFEGETCQKLGGFHHLGKGRSEKGKAACEAKSADLALFFALLTPARRKGRGNALRGLPADENRPISGRTPSKSGIRC